jgi:hypothetical protein
MQSGDGEDERDLSSPEIKTLYNLLKKLDFYHNDIFQNKKGRSLEELSSE